MSEEEDKKTEKQKDNDFDELVKEVEDKEANLRKRNFSLQRNYFFETHDKDKNLTSKMTEEEWKKKVIDEVFFNPGIEQVKRISGIFHDRDIAVVETGELKTLHFHGILEFEHPQRLKNVKEIVNAHSYFKPTKSIPGSMLYLTHTTPTAILEQKVRYEVKEVLIKEQGRTDFLKGEELEARYRELICGKLESQKHQKQKDNAKEIARIQGVVEEAANKILKNEIADLIEAQEFLTDNDVSLTMFSNKKKVFIDALNLRNDKKYKQTKGRNRPDLKLIYIEGPSEVGKTRLAKLLAKTLNSFVGVDENSIYNASTKSKGTSYDFIQGFDNEKSVIFDEQDLTDLEYGQFKLMFDENLSPAISSRFKNKLLTSSFHFIVKSEDINSQIFELCEKEVNKFRKKKYLTEERIEEEIENVYYQVKRRFDLIIHIDKKSISFYRYKLTSRGEYNKKLLKKYNFSFKEINNLEEDRNNPIYNDFFDSMKNELFINEFLQIIGMKGNK